MQNWTPGNLKIDKRYLKCTKIDAKKEKEKEIEMEKENE